MNLDLSPIVLTLRVAALSTALLVVVALPLSWWIVQGRSRLRWGARLLVNLPLVMPPTVLGFLLLALFSPATAAGRFLTGTLGLEVLFTWKALVVGSVVGGLPYMCNPLIGGIESLPRTIGEASAVLGKGPLETFLRVLLPAFRPALLAGITLTFAHACGEFGVVLMVGGKIPGATTTAALALYDAVELSDHRTAAGYALVLLALGSLVLVPAVRAGRLALGSRS